MDGHDGGAASAKVARNNSKWKDSNNDGKVNFDEVVVMEHAHVEHTLVLSQAYPRNLYHFIPIKSMRTV